MASPVASSSKILLDGAILIKQGAEAKVYSTSTFFPPPAVYWPPSTNSQPVSSTSEAVSEVILKHRFPKQYRHPILDQSLTKSRLSFEARALARCRKAGITVPKIIWVDETSGVLGMEKVDGWSIREVLGGGAEGELEVEVDEEVEVEAGEVEQSEEAQVEEDLEPSEGMEALEKLGVTKERLMSAIGTALAKLHATNTIHGDLTTSNMMVRLTPDANEPFEIVGPSQGVYADNQVLIDFGLCSTAQYAENFAVDLYVLERAFISTHPQSENLYAGVLEAYSKTLGEKKWKPIQLKLKEVRFRGRKRDMIG